MENKLFALAIMEIRKYPYTREYIATQSFLHSAERRGKAKDVETLQKVINDLKARIDYITNRQQRIFDLQKLALLFASDAEQAAETGDADSIRLLAYGTLFQPLWQAEMTGKERQESLDRSLSWFSQLADGDPLAKTLCGEIYQHAYYPTRDVDRGSRLLEEAAMSAIPIAAYILGNRNFFLPPRNYGEAINWYKTFPMFHDLNWRIGVCYFQIGSKAGAELYIGLAVKSQEQYISRFQACRKKQIKQVDLAYHAGSEATTMDILQEVIDRCDLWEH